MSGEPVHTWRDRRLEPVQTILQRCVAFGLRKELIRAPTARR